MTDYTSSRPTISIATCRAEIAGVTRIMTLACGTTTTFLLKCLEKIMEYRLRIGRKLSGLIVRQDDKYPQMWRIHYKGQISDMVNLTRAKDAAMSWVRPKGLGGDETTQWDRRQTAA